MGLFDKKDLAKEQDQKKDTNAELLAQMQQMFQQMITPLQQEIQILKAQGGQQPAPKSEPTPEKHPSIFDNPEELDQMPLSKALLNLREELGRQLETVVKEAVKPIGERFQQSEASQRKSAIENAWIQFTQGKDDSNKLQHPDWQDWKEDMFQVMKEKRGLTFEEAYDLVKIRAQRTSPERYQQIQEKYWPKPKPEEKDTPYGGYLPSNIGFPTGEKTVDSVEEAAHFALQQMKETGWGDLPLSDTKPS